MKAAALALVGGSTRESVILLTNKGSAYTLRIHDVPQSTGHGTPVQQLFKFKDGEKVPENFTYASDTNSEWMSVEELRAWIDQNRDKIGHL